MYDQLSERTDVYHQSDLAMQVAAATPHQLVLILFDGLMTELIRVKAHISHKHYDKKAQSINKCIDIINVLNSALNFEEGGEIALNLAKLYDYCVYRLYEASASLSIETIEDVEKILNNIREGWEGMSQ